jgi:hypothetical protein
MGVDGRQARCAVSFIRSGQYGGGDNPRLEDGRHVDQHRVAIDHNLALSVTMMNWRHSLLPRIWPTPDP